MQYQVAKVYIFHYSKFRIISYFSTIMFQTLNHI